MKNLILFVLLVFCTTLFPDNIYFGPGQQIASFEEAFEIAETGDHLIKYRIDTFELPAPVPGDAHSIKWLSFPALDVILNTGDIAENVLGDELLDPDILFEVDFYGNDDI